MGRQQFWTRLALGRSAYLKLEEHHEPQEANPAVQYQQNYNAQGRASNPETQFRNGEMRRAQNSVLKLVGIVEERDQRALAKHEGLSRQQEVRWRSDLLEREDEEGEFLDIIIFAVQQFVNWFPATLLARFQIGLYDARTSFIDSLRYHFSSAAGCKGVLAGLLPGAAAQLAHTVLRVLLRISVEAGIGQLQELLIARKKIGRKDARFWHSALQWLSAGSLSLIEVVTFPLQFLAISQMLGLHPPLPLLPSWRSFIPWGPGSVHAFARKPLLRVPILGVLISPAALLLLWSLIHDTNEPAQGITAFNAFTSYRDPPVNATFHQSKFSMGCDPLGWILHGLYSLRRRFLKSCHWSLEVSQGHQGASTFVDNVSIQNEQGSPQRIRHHRSTALAHLPAQNLSRQVDLVLHRLLLMPLQCMVFRAVSVAFLRTDFPKTAFAMTAGPSLSPTFRGGPIERILTTGMSVTSLKEIGQWMNKIGLCIALQVGFDTCIFAAAYHLARNHGLNRYWWRVAGLETLPDSQGVD